jgi:hypothetical protein
MSDLLEDDALFAHEPLRPVRTDVVGEVVFMRHWKALQDSDDKPEDLDGRNSILRDILRLVRHQVTQRDATVCASLIRWLGTNNGQAFLGSAESMARKLGDREDGYVAAWAIENIRDAQWNQGFNCVDSALSTPSPALGGDGRIVVDISGHDIDTVNMMIQWLGCPRGDRFLEGCRKEIATEIALGHQRHQGDAGINRV